MQYLLVTHIPAFAGQSPGVIRWQNDWLADLASQSRALADEGFELTIAAPLLATLDAKTLARHQISDIKIADQPWRFVALPGYRTATQFVTQRASIRKSVQSLSSDADIVQFGPGGHPISLGQTIYPDLLKTPAKRLFLIGQDPIPAQERYAASGRNPAKRVAKQLAVRQLRSFCAKAIAQSDLVIAQDPAVALRFAKEWHPRCHTLLTTGLPDAQIGTARQKSDRHPLRIVAFASDQFTRGLDHLIRAFAKAKRLSARIELNLAGDLIGSAPMMDLIRDEHLDSTVRLHGKLTPDQSRDLMNRCDVLAITPLIPIADPLLPRALAGGLAVVMYASGTANDAFLTESGAGLLVPRGDVNMLAQSLLDLSRDRERFQKMSRSAIAWSQGASLDALHQQRARLAKSVVKR
jgi:hypothetical protein